jgi:hypothetical protein
MQTRIFKAYSRYQLDWLLPAGYKLTGKLVSINGVAATGKSVQESH